MYNSKEMGIQVFVQSLQGNIQEVCEFQISKKIIIGQFNIH